MKLKSKIISVLCAGALAMMMPAAAFAADRHEVNISPFNGSISNLQAEVYDGVNIQGASISNATLYNIQQNYGYTDDRVIGSFATKSTIGNNVTNTDAYYTMIITNSLARNTTATVYADLTGNGDYKVYSLPIKTDGSAIFIAPSYGNYVIVDGNNTNAGGGSSSTAKGVTMYRLYNPNSGEHFYTSNNAEVTNLRSAGWKYEGAAWTAPASGTAVYRMYNPNVGDHHYTTDANERNTLQSKGWKYEGIGWYSATSTGTPLYRLYNPNAVTGSHHYTTDANERNTLQTKGWKYEGIGWYGTK